MNKQRENIVSIGISREESRFKRETQTLSLRRKDREERLSKRRNQTLESSEKNSINLNELQFLIQQLHSQDLNEIILSATSFRRLLSKKTNPPIDEVINCGIVPRLIEVLSFDNEKLQYESLWCITNIASGSHEHTAYLVSLNLIPIILMFCDSPNHKVREQAFWAIGNIAGDCVEFRDMVLQCGGLQKVLDILEREEHINVIKVTTWVMSNLCRGKQSPPFDDVKSAVPVAAKLIYSKDKDIVIDALWTLAFLSDGKDKRQKAVADQDGICLQLVQFLDSKDLSILLPSLRTVGNLLSGDNETTQKVIDANVLDSLKDLLEHEKIGVRKEACWCISNILAGPPNQIQEVVDSNITPQLLNMIINDRFDVKKEAGWCIANAVSGAHPKQIFYFAYQGCVQILCTLLHIKDLNLIDMILDALERCLKFGKRIQEEKHTPFNSFAKLIEDCGGLENLETIYRSIDEEKINMKVYNIITKYFKNEEESIIGVNEEMTFNVEDQGRPYQI